MGIVRILPSEVVSKIAAGEVIQRPVSVVKELVENSLDAGADRVEIEVVDGGLGTILVKDNGQGMEKEDLELCIMRHATSKIRDLDDLFSTTSYGFRGEALPSIAAVSRLRILTRPRASQMGHVLKVQGTGPALIEPCQCPPGTIVEVRDLFYNTPVRKKFLRSHPTEFRYILEWVIKMAFACPQTRILLIRDHKEVLNLEKQEDPSKRIPELWGPELEQGIKRIDQRDGDLKLSLYVLPLEHTRPRPDRLLFYVNSRPIRDKNLLKAVTDAFLYAIPKGLYPQCLVFLEIPPDEIDVNVHPQKEEVQFKDMQRVYRLIFKSIDKFLKQPLYPEPHGIKKEEDLKVKEEQRPYWSPRDLHRVPIGIPPGQEMKVRTFKIVGQVKGLYIICEAKDGIYIFDQHAVHERLIYERLLELYLRKGIQSQPLLFPYVFDPGPGDYELLMEHRGLMEGLGIRLEPFGGRSLALYQVPVLLKDADWEGLIQSLIETLSRDGRKKEGLYNEVISRMACHAAMRAGKGLTLEEMERLIDQVAEGEMNKSCPHGRPVYKFISFQELEREFKRR